MNENQDRVEQASTTEGLPVAVSMGNALQSALVPRKPTTVTTRVVFISAVAIGIGVAAALIAQLLLHLLALVTHIAFYGQISARIDDPHASPSQNALGVWVVAIPVVGGIIVGLMARYGHKAIRGHGIPEAMEQVLTNQSRIPPRITFLKPLSAAIAIGTGGPFGAEGPIIATGGALGSLVGQVLVTSAAERKTLLAAGAAGGMAATFGSPVAAVLLAVELLLFEFRARSIVPVALAAVTATAIRLGFDGMHPVFAMPDILAPSGGAIAFYVLVGLLAGIVSVGVTRAVYWVEDLFERLPIHWMWWPAIGAVVVGVVGYFSPLTLGVGYSNITRILSFGQAGNEQFTMRFIALLCGLKFISWVIALGSGTSGGTLAPLFTIGGGVGALIGAAGHAIAPAAGIDVRVCALVGMASIFAGASRAMLASAVFAFETTMQPMGLLPLLGGCTAAYLVSALLMRNTIMTEKIARRGVRVPSDYEADFLDQVLVGDACVRDVVTLEASQLLGDVRRWLASGRPEASHQGFPVVDKNHHLLGVLTRRDLLDPRHADDALLQSLLRRPPSAVYEDCTLREAVDHMLRHEVGRLPVILRRQPHRLIGIITRSDVLLAHRPRIDDAEMKRAITVPHFWRRNTSAPTHSDSDSPA